MGEETKKGTGKPKTPLVISVIVIVILAGLNIWFAMNKQSLQLQIGELWDNYGREQWWHSYYLNVSEQFETEKEALESEYTDYMGTHHYTDSEYNTLQSTYNSYVTTHRHTNVEYDTLNATYQNYMATQSQ